MTFDVQISNVHLGLKIPKVGKRYWSNERMNKSGPKMVPWCLMFILYDSLPFTFSILVLKSNHNCTLVELELLEFLLHCSLSLSHTHRFRFRLRFQTYKRPDRLHPKITNYKLIIIIPLPTYLHCIHSWFPWSWLCCHSPGLVGYFGLQSTNGQYSVANSSSKAGYNRSLKP